MGRQVTLDPYKPIGLHKWRQIEIGSEDPMMKCKNCDIQARKSEIGKMKRCSRTV